MFSEETEELIARVLFVVLAVWFAAEVGKNIYNTHQVNVSFEEKKKVIDGFFVQFDKECRARGFTGHRRKLAYRWAGLQILKHYTDGVVFAEYRKLDIYIDEVIRRATR